VTWVLACGVGRELVGRSELSLKRAQLRWLHYWKPSKRINQGLESLVLIHPLLDRPNNTRSFRTFAHQEKKTKRKCVAIITNHCSVQPAIQNHHRARPIFRRSIGAVVPRKSEVAWRGNNVTDSGCKVGRVAGGGTQGKQSGTNLSPLSVPGLVLMRTRRVKADAKQNFLLRHSAFFTSGQR